MPTATRTAAILGFDGSIISMLVAPVRVDDRTSRDLDRRIAGVRRRFVDTLARRLAPRTKSAPGRRRR